MSRRFLLLVALLFCITLRGRSQIDLNDHSAAAFPVELHAKLRTQLPQKSCAVLFSGGLLGYDPHFQFQAPFSADPDFLLLSKLEVPDAVLVIFAEPRQMAEGLASTLIFLPDKNDQGLASMGLHFGGKMGLVGKDIILRPASQWEKFCKEILSAEDVQKIYAKPLSQAGFRKPGEPDFQDLGRIFYQMLSPGYPFEPLAQRLYKDILAADSAAIPALKSKAAARLEYQLPGYKDPMLDRLQAVRSLKELQSLQSDLSKVKIDLLKLEGWLDMLVLEKSATEIAAYRKLAQALADAFKVAANRLKEGAKEFEVAAQAEWLIKRRGYSLPMPHRVASGEHSAQPNYITNNSTLPSTGICILDFALGKEGSSIRATRTFPSGTGFGGETAQVYQDLLTIHKKSLNAAKPGGSPSKLLAEATDAFEAMEKQYIFGTNAIGRGRVIKLVNVRLVGLGLEQRPLPAKFSKGMLLEVETALYIPDKEGITAKWKGTGMAILDWVWLTEEGNEVLTKGIPTELEGMNVWKTATNKLLED